MQLKMARKGTGDLARASINFLYSDGGSQFDKPRAVQ